MIEIDDSVKVIGGGPELWTVVGTRTEEPCYNIQLGNDAALRQRKRTSELELVAKAEKPAVEPGFVPGRGIME